MDLGEEDLLRLTQAGVTLSLGPSKKQQRVASIAVVADQTLDVPPLWETEIMAKVPGVAGADTWLVESQPLEDRSCVVVARAVVAPEGGHIPVRILNPRNEPVTLRKGEKIAQMEPLLEEVAVPSTTIQKPAETEVEQETLWQLVTHSAT